MDPEQARTEYFGTRVIPEAPGDVCHLPLGMEGTQFSFDSMHGAISEDQAEAIHKSVKEVFESKGLRVVQPQPSGANRDQTTTGFGDGKSPIQLGTSSFGTTLGGNTRCAPDPEGKFQ